jgi:hypothetical protein
MADELIISPNPILTELLLGEEDGGYVRFLFGLGLADDPIEPTAVHDPERPWVAAEVWDRAVTPFATANQVSLMTPTGTFKLGTLGAGQ